MTAGSIPAPLYRERRIERARHSIELVLDEVFRPGDWAARIMYRLGLQGRLRATTTVVRTGGASSPRSSPLRIAFASDFHAGPTTDDRLLARACMALHHLEPDVLLLGGDFVSVRASDISRLARHLAAIHAPHGKFAVLGNHDLRSNCGEVVDALTEAGVQLLSNARTTLAGPFSDVTICGLDDPTRGRPRADLALEGATGTRIVLKHSPEGLASIGDRPFDLALCGHTHGGQVVLPFGRPIWIPGEGLNRQYASGRFTVGPDGSRTLLVSRGIGCSTIPVRAFAAPEVHLCLIV
jgi:predicted MPP superfamily phosphohydrolase